MYEDSALNFPRAGKRLYSIVHPLTTTWFQDGFFQVTIVRGRVLFCRAEGTILPITDIVTRCTKYVLGIPAVQIKVKNQFSASEGCIYIIHTQQHIHAYRCHTAILGSTQVCVLHVQLAKPGTFRPRDGAMYDSGNVAT